LSRSPGRDGKVAASSADAETEETVIAIAGLRWRLTRHGSLQDPRIQRELRKLEQDVLTQFEQTAPSSGRHRSEAGRTRSCPLELKPDPLGARTAAEFTRVLRQYRAWSGMTYREIEARAGNDMVHSTIWTAMHGSALPSLDVVQAVLTGCGGSQDDLTAFTTAWRRVSTATGRDPASGTGFQAVPVPARRLLPGG
jgi:hypothetical protein